MKTILDFLSDDLKIIESIDSEKVKKLKRKQQSIDDFSYVIAQDFLITAKEMYMQDAEGKNFEEFTIQNVMKSDEIGKYVKQWFSLVENRVPEILYDMLNDAAKVKADSNSEQTDIKPDTKISV